MLLLEEKTCFRNIMSLSEKVVTCSRHLENIAKVLCNSVMETKELCSQNQYLALYGEAGGTLTKSERHQLCLTGTSSVCWCKPPSPSVGQGPPTERQHTTNDVFHLSQELEFGT